MINSHPNGLVLLNVTSKGKLNVKVLLEELLIDVCVIPSVIP
jgi:hypothetical protein